MTIRVRSRSDPPPTPPPTRRAAPAVAPRPERSERARSRGTTGAGSPASSVAVYTSCCTKARVPALPAVPVTAGNAEVDRGDGTVDDHGRRTRPGAGSDVERAGRCLHGEELPHPREAGASGVAPAPAPKTRTATGAADRGRPTRQHDRSAAKPWARPSGRPSPSASGSRAPDRTPRWRRRAQGWRR